MNKFLSIMALMLMPAISQGIIESEKIVASDGITGDSFGAAVAGQGSVLLVGAPNTPVFFAGSVYVYEKDLAGLWQETAEIIPSDPAFLTTFGTSIAGMTDLALIGRTMDNDMQPSAGAMYVFKQDLGTGQWNELYKLYASDAGNGDQFGTSVATDDGYAIIGAPFDDIGAAANVGSAYVFQRDSGDNLTEVAKLEASDGTGGDNFGFSVAISGAAAVIGAPWDDEDGFATGSAYYFIRKNNGDWVEKAKLYGPNPTVNDLFGRSVAIAGNQILVGAPFADDAGGVSVGAVYVLEKKGNKWDVKHTLMSPVPNSGDAFGWSMTVDGDRVVIGARGESVSSGASYIFTRNGNGSWSHAETMIASDGMSNDRLGESVTIIGDEAISGAPLGDGASAADSGAVYVHPMP